MQHLLSRKELTTETSKLINQFAVPIAFFGSFVTAPQVWNIWILKQVDGVSLITFGFFFVGNLFWFTYGLLHNDKAIMISNVTQGALNLLVVVGKILF